ncbi:MAG: nucleotide-binding protein [Chthoniobacterales bacterium]|nr:nucleotide-binding protein [Chthoniobacterales bacterium]
MDKRPTVFIGSSSEGSPVAEALKAQFGDKAVVDVWNNNAVFERGVSFFESLVNASSLYDFAILVFTGDDATTSRKRTHASARDNVLFEYGLFLGHAGKRRAYAFVQDKLHVPSDLAGIHFDHFKFGANKKLDAAFGETASRLVADMLDYHANTAEFSQLPSTALAIGYFENFISRICNQLDNYEPVTIKDRQLNYTSFTLNIVIADDLRLVEQDNLRSIIRGLEQVKVTASGFRDFPFYVQSVPAEGDTHLELFDIPTTMKSCRRAIQKIFASEYLGKNNLQKRAEQREISNFEHTLRLLIDDVPVWKPNIKYRYLSEFVRSTDT